MNRKKPIACFLTTTVLLATLTGCDSGFVPGGSAEKKPVEVTVWTYYNGEQLESFTRLVDTFNQTIGQEKNIVVTCSSSGNVDDLESDVLAAAEGKVGADPMPNMFSAYSDNAYTMDQKGLLEDLAPYFTEEEKSKYIAGYLEEGDLCGDGSLKIIPTAKSTELLFLNETDWEPFAAAIGASYEDMETIEGLVETAEKYYEWTDSQTPEPNDGKALFGRDAMANYILVGAKQLGDTIFDAHDGALTLHFEKDIVRKLWDNYYIPFIKGYFAASGRFRSDDIKTGNIIAYVGSTSSATFFPKEVVSEDDSTHEITLKVLPNPRFQDGERFMVQQGAGIAVTQAEPEKVEACVAFLKWLTQPEQNLAFCADSGYLPVTKEANTMDEVDKSGIQISESGREVLSTAFEQLSQSEMYTNHAFTDGKSARAVIEYAMSDCAAADRETVKEKMAQGESLEEATEEFLSDAYFDAWYENTRSELEKFQ